MIIDLLDCTRIIQVMNQNSNFFKEVEDTTYNFLNLIKKPNKNFSYFPTESGLTKGGRNLELGFSCFAIKIFYILGYWEKLSDEEKINWGNYINKFQQNILNIPNNSYVDNVLVDNYLNIDFSRIHKDFAKFLLNNLNIKNYDSKKDNLQTSVRAETKQAISTLYQVSLRPKYNYDQFPNKKNELDEFFKKLDWSKPWNAGAQYAGICVFSKNIDSHETLEYLHKFSDSIVNPNNGAYYLGSQPNKSELINGTMKVISGLDWIDQDIHYPKKLIDLCISSFPENDGCDLVDIIYVIFQCSKVTNYKKKEIINYVSEILKIIKNHYFRETGGFSYFLNKSQTHYYGVKISKGLNHPDIHGTTLLIWALSMIREILEPENNNWKILKP